MGLCSRLLLYFFFGLFEDHYQITVWFAGQLIEFRKSRWERDRLSTNRFPWVNTQMSYLESTSTQRSWFHVYFQHDLCHTKKKRILKKIWRQGMQILTNQAVTCGLSETKNSSKSKALIITMETPKNRAKDISLRLVCARSKEFVIKTLNRSPWPSHKHEWNE